MLGLRAWTLSPTLRDLSVLLFTVDKLMFFNIAWPPLSVVTLGSKYSSNQFYCSGAVLSIKSVMWRSKLLDFRYLELEVLYLKSRLVKNCLYSEDINWVPLSLIISFSIQNQVKIVLLWLAIVDASMFDRYKILTNLEV